MLKKFYSVKDASKIIGVSTNTIYKYLDDGSLKGKRMGGRGRFKIPFSEVAPYTAKAVSPVAVEKISDNMADSDVKTSVENSGNKSSFIGSLFETTAVGVGVLVLVWGIGSIAMGTAPVLIQNVGGAMLNYSGRTFSGFGNLISRATPAKNVESPQVAGIITSTTPAAAIPETKTPDATDIKSKFKDTERLAYELYANTQTLDSSAQKLLGKARTLTTSELNDAVAGMLELENVIIAQTNNMADSWKFPALDSMQRTNDQTASILDLLAKGSLGAFTKPEVKDLNGLVAQTDLLQQLVGNITDTTADTTVFGNLRKVQVLAKAVDDKNAEVDKILGSWDGYNISEKENSVKGILSDTFSINVLPNVDEIIPSNPSPQAGDVELKNVLYAARGILDANKMHLTQKANQPVAVTWVESDGALYKALMVNPSEKLPQKVAYKYYLPADFKRGDVRNAASGLTLNFDSQKNQYFMAADVQLPAGNVKTLSLQVGEIQSAAATIYSPLVAEATQAQKPLAAVPAPGQTEVLGTKTENLIPATPTATTTPAVAAAATEAIPSIEPTPLKVAPATTYPAPSYKGVAARTQGISPDVQRIIGIAISVLAFGTLAVYLVILFLKRERKPKIVKTARSAIKIGTIAKNAALPVKRLAIGLFRIPVSIFKFIVRVLSSIKKMLVSLVKGIVKVLVAIVMFPVRIVRAIVSAIAAFLKKVVYLVVSVGKFIFGIPGAILNVILKIVRVVKNFFVSLAKGLINLVASVTAFVKKMIESAIRAVVALITNVASSIVNFFVSIVTGTKKLTTSMVASVKRFIANIIKAIATLIGKVISAVKVFIGKIVSAVINAILTVKQAILAIASAIKDFFLRITRLFNSLVVSFVAGIFGAADKTVITSTKVAKSVSISIIKLAVSVKTGVLRILAAIKNLILSVAASVVNFVVAVAIAVNKAIQTVIRTIFKFVTDTILAVKNFIVKTINSIITFIEKIIFAVTKAITFLIAGIVKTLVSIETFLLKTVSLITKALVAAVTGILKVLVAITERTDSTLTNIRFDAPRLPGSRVHYRKASVFILVAITSAVISSVFAISVVAQIEKSPAAFFGVEKSSNNGSVSEPSGDSAKMERVIVTGTPTGWLRVRSAPGGSEIGRVYPGEALFLLDKKEGWMQIALPTGQKGWISSKYATLE